MKVLCLLFAFLLILPFSHVSGKELLFEAPKPSSNSSNNPNKEKRSKQKSTPRSKESRNLPRYHLEGLKAHGLAKSFQASKQSKSYEAGIQVGSFLSGRIGHSVVALPNEKIPISAKIESLASRGCHALGFVRLEPNSKRIFAEFTTLSCGAKTFEFLAQGMDLSGKMGLEGRYHSREKELFWGHFVSSFTAAYFDSLVPRYSTIFGQNQEESSANAAMKKGLAGGAMASAEHFKEKLKRLPEFSEIQGPIPIKLLIIQRAQRI